MTTPEQWRARFEEQTGVPFENLLAEISVEQPAGQSLQGGAIYREIQQARLRDDPSLPHEGWEPELKRADWRKVQHLTLRALAEQSKDLQLMVWLLEAQIHRLGFAGIAPVIHLLDRLCAKHWLSLYPRITDGDSEHRENILHSANQKLQPVLRLVAVSVSEDVSLSWADVLRARRNQSLLDSGVDPSELEGPVLSDCQKTLLAASDNHLLNMHADITAAVASLDELRITLSELQSLDAPTLSGLGAVLGEISDFLMAELKHRGYRKPSDSEVSMEGSLALEGEESSATGRRSPTLVPQPIEQLRRISSVPASQGSGAPLDLARERSVAYAQLDQVADMLLRVDPHSPTPYLIKRAVAWGELSTAQLYQELFVRCEGKLSIFELMGIQAGDA